MVYVDVFVAGVGKWYEFKCEETALIRDLIKEIYDVIYHPQQVRIQPSSVHEEKREAHWTLYTVIPVFPHSFYRERRGFIFTGIAPEQVFFKCISAQSFYFSIHNIDMQCLRFFR